MKIFFIGNFFFRAAPEILSGRATTGSAHASVVPTASHPTYRCRDCGNRNRILESDSYKSIYQFTISSTSS
ncbi:hypothetical protein LEP1GSC061_3281 [Leptospira wolffii serovar Khorat str. Khorat-H2]|nr:hypothetical protein LEP1GSC061_3281 [Leptospira wolffii serovar Khorat str. Khorat-H2]